MAKKKHKCWGDFNGQTVRKESPTHIVIREGQNIVSVNNGEVDSLIMALLTIRGKK